MADDEDGALDLDAALERAFTGRWAMSLGIGLGHDAGLLTAFAASPTTAADLAASVGSDPRMTEEWLHVMVVSGFAGHKDGVFTPAPGLDGFAGDGRAETPAGAFAAMMNRDARLMPLLTHALRHGGGVSPEAYEPEGTLAQDVLGAEAIENDLVPKVLGAVPGLAEQLAEGIDVLDIGCGSGRGVVVMARANPSSRYTGYDLAPEAIARARTKAAEAGVDATFTERDIVDLPAASFDLITAIDVIHDLGDPLGVLAAARQGLRDGGLFLMCETTATGDFEVDRHSDSSWEFFTSFANCVPKSQAFGGPGLGSMWGVAGALPLLEEAGFTDVTTHETDSGSTVFACRATTRATATAAATTT